MVEQLELRVHGAADLPTLIYLPGLHGDWTLVGSFRRALDGRLRFVEITYPRTLNWSLEDYAAAVEEALAKSGIMRGWLLAESYGSQVAWPIVRRKRFPLDGLILAGGFVRHPAPWGVRLAERACTGVSLTLMARILRGYAKVARWRFRRCPEVLDNLKEFIARRTERDRDAATHRLALIAHNDPRPIARKATLPILAITGALDPIVPWVWVRAWLRRNCPALKQYKVVWHADHNVLSTGARAAAESVVQWMTTPA